jgi:hypothetical protein
MPFTRFYGCILEENSNQCLHFGEGRKQHFEGTDDLSLEVFELDS